MRPLRFRYAWLIGGILLLCLVLYLTLSKTGAGVADVNDKVAHGVAFTLLMLWFCGVFRRPFSPLVAIALVAVGVAIELIQDQLVYRMADVGDGFADVIGIAAGWILALSGVDRWTALIENWLPPRYR